MKIEYKKIFLAVFLVWVVLWINFMIRDLTKKKYFKAYKALLSRDSMGKRSYVYGDRLFEFLVFCEKELPEGATYNIVGLEAGSIDPRRSIYYLYPHFNEESAQYTLVFDRPGYTKTGYVIFKELKPGSFILERAN